MTLSLAKGGNLSLSKAVAESGGTLHRLGVGLGWNPRQTSGDKFDLDASAVPVKEDNQILGQDWFIFYNQLSSPGDLIRHLGDNRTGEGDGDDEVIECDLSKLPEEIKKIIFPVTIDEAKTRQQNFGMVDGAYIRVWDLDSGTELARFDLSEDGGGLDCVVFGEVYRDPSNPDEWKFKAIEQGFNDGLGGLARAHGVGIS